MELTDIVTHECSIEIVKVRIELLTHLILGCNIPFRGLRHHRAHLMGVYRCLENRLCYRIVGEFDRFDLRIGRLQTIVKIECLFSLKTIKEKYPATPICTQ